MKNNRNEMKIMKTPPLVMKIIGDVFPKRGIHGARGAGSMFNLGGIPAVGDLDQVGARGVSQGNIPVRKMHYKFTGTKHRALCQVVQQVADNRPFFKQQLKTFES